MTDEVDKQDLPYFHLLEIQANGSEKSQPFDVHRVFQRFDERGAIEAQRRREDREKEEEKERQRKEQEAAEAQRRQEEEAEALRTQQEAEAAANIPPPPVEDEDPNLTFWSAHENQGKTYYYNSQTRESTYEKPVGFSEPEKVKNESPHVEL